LLRQFSQGFARLLQLGDSLVEFCYAHSCELVRARPIMGRVERQQLCYLLKRESSGLARPDEAEATNVVLVISPDAACAAAAIWPAGCPQQAAALIVANGFNPDIAGSRDANDGQLRHLLTPYHGTHSI
jgi:hypothetical protein